MSKQEKKGFEEDNRVIADMNVEGMPWYDKQKKLDEKRAKMIENNQIGAPSPLSKKELVSAVFGALGAVLLIFAAFAGAAAAFIWFCTNVWFR